MKAKIKIALISTILILFMTIKTQAQNDTSKTTATIYLIRSKAGFGVGVASYIKFQNQERIGLPVGSVVEYKVYSEGDFFVTAEFVNIGTSNCNLTVKHGGVYYLYFDAGKFSEVTVDKVQKIIDKPRSYAKLTENLDFPINKSSLR